MYLKLLQTSDRSTVIGKTIPEPVKNSNIFLNPYNLWDVDPAALKSLNYTDDRDSMYNHYPRTTTHLPRTDLYPQFSSLGTIDSKRKRLRVSFACYRKYYLPDGRVEETFATVEKLSDLWKPGALVGIPTFAMKCSCIQE